MDGMEISVGTDSKSTAVLINLQARILKSTMSIENIELFSLEA